MLESELTFTINSGEKNPSKSSLYLVSAAGNHCGSISFSFDGPFFVLVPTFLCHPEEFSVCLSLYQYINSPLYLACYLPCTQSL